MSDPKSQSGLRRRLHYAPLLKQLGPGLITGAADDDPSGIATYSQGGAQFGFNLLWTMLLTFPLMAAIQMVSALVGRVTGRGLAYNMGQVMPRPLVLGLLARSGQFVKCATGADLLPRLFAHSLYEVEPKLGACLEIAGWKGGRTDLEQALYREAD